MTPKIFLSHITEENEIASIIREEIERSFLGLVDVFQSSDQTSLAVGRNWLNSITDALRNCQAIIVFCSPYSIKRPWINFECGAGWARDIEVVPICHSGLRPVDLPIPLSLLEGVDGKDSTALEAVFNMISKKLGGHAPQIDTKEISSKIAAFSDKYVLEIEIYTNLRQIKSVSIELFQSLGGLYTNKVRVIRNLPERIIERCHQSLDHLQNMKLLSYNYSVMGIGFGGNGGGNFGDLTIEISPKLSEAILVILQEN